MRPLDFLGRIKVKLGIVIVLAVVAAFGVNEVGINSGLSRDLRIAIAVVLALIMVQLLARGMTRPLREMAAAAQTIAKGRYGLRVTATSRDEVGELARAFNAMAADLAEVDRQRRELVANVSHELRTPITGLQAVLENVVDGVTPPDLDTLGTALAQTQRLGRLVTQLLDLSRLDSGARLIEPEELDLASLCRQAASEAALARDDVTVVSTVAPETVLYADPALLAQVLANLLDNAVRHSPPGGTVRVHARAVGPHLEISVTDEGPGIPQAERARVFERFSRLDAGRAADAGGAGLGLAIAKEIVELHGGSIAVADPPVAQWSERGHRGTAPGCRMVVTLPRHGEHVAGESKDGPIHADERRGNMEIEAGGGPHVDGHRAEGHREDGTSDGSSRTAGSGLPAAAGSGSTAAAGASPPKSTGSGTPQADRSGVSDAVGNVSPQVAGGGACGAVGNGSLETAGTGVFDAVRNGSPEAATNAAYGTAGTGSAGTAGSGSPGDTAAPAIGPDGVQVVAQPNGGAERPAQSVGDGKARSEQDERPEAGQTESPEPLQVVGMIRAVQSTKADHHDATLPRTDHPEAAGPEAGQSEAGDSEAAHPEVGRYRAAVPGAGRPGAGYAGGEARLSSRDGIGDGEDRDGELSDRSRQPGHVGTDLAHGTAPADSERPQEAGSECPQEAGSGRLREVGSERPQETGSGRLQETDSGRLQEAGTERSQEQVRALHPHAYNRVSRSARAALGAGAGMFAGFFVGLFAAFFIGLFGGEFFGVVAMLLFTAGGAVAGAAVGSSSSQRVAAHVNVLPRPGQSTESVPVPSAAAPLPMSPASASSASAPPVSASSASSVSVSSASVSSASSLSVSSSASVLASTASSVSASPVHAHAPSVSGASVSGATASKATTSGTTASKATASGAAAPKGTAAKGTPSGATASGAFGAGRYSPPPAYVPPPLFPRPELPDAPRWLLPAAAAAGLVAAVSLPDASPGLGFALTAVAMGAAAFPAVLPLRRGRITPWTVAFGLLAYALVSVVLFRDADWLVGPVSLAAFGVGSLAVSGGGRGWLAVIKGGVSVVFALLPQPWFLSGPLRRLTRRRMLPTLVSALVTVVLLAVFGLLFASADAVFSAFLSDLLGTPDWVKSLPFRIFLFCMFAALAAAAVLVGLRPVAEPAAPDLRMSIGRQVWMIPLIGLNLLFAAFVTVQITVLFGGSRRVLTTAGLTYAQYARSGFFELVTVSVFVLGIVAAAVALLRRESRADRWLLAVLLGLLCAFTLVILASALHRLGLYTDAYGLSRLRASVEATIWWLGAVFVLVLAVGAVRLAGGGTSWFFRAFVLLTGVSLFVFAVWDPDARVAETQLTVRGVERLDHDYLSELGAEAVPILDRLPEPDRSCVLSEVVAANDLWKPDPWNGWNLARARAREVLERRPVVPPVSPSRDCPGSSRVPGPYY